MVVSSTDGSYVMFLNRTASKLFLKQIMHFSHFFPNSSKLSIYFFRTCFSSLIETGAVGHFGGDAEVEMEEAAAAPGVAHMAALAYRSAAELP